MPLSRDQKSKARTVVYMKAFQLQWALINTCDWTGKIVNRQLYMYNITPLFINSLREDTQTHILYKDFVSGWLVELSPASLYLLLVDDLLCDAFVIG